MIQLAKNLHKQNPTQHYKFYDDDKYYERFKQSEEEYPAIKPSSEEEEWVQDHYIGLINTFPFRWQLYLLITPSDLPSSEIFWD
ncbi:hypothetical protein FJY90_04720 [Candidatus Gottesmanbacteria bacterium]|nr:hypothetical protein [Candidatus Gottesmanbacteria bacterium]